MGRNLLTVKYIRNISYRVMNTLRHLALTLSGIFLKYQTKKSIRINLKYIFDFSAFNKRALPKEFLFKPSKSFYNNCTNNLPLASLEIARHCKLPIPINIMHGLLNVPSKIIQLDIFNPDKPGQFIKLSIFEYFIYVNSEYGESITAAILSHEITHAFISYHNIEFKTKHFDKNKFAEQMTDLSTIALGLGDLLIKGNSYTCIRGDYEIRGNIGYLSDRKMKYAQRFMRLLFKEETIRQSKK